MVRSRPPLAQPSPYPLKPPVDGTVRIANLNVKSLGGSWGGAARDEIQRDVVSFLTDENVNPDVVVLEELDRFTERSGKRDQLADLAAEAGGTDFFFAKAFDRQGGAYGVGILCRNGFTLERTGDDVVRGILLPRLGAIEPRAAIIAPVRAPNGDTFDVLGTHLSISKRVSTKQLEYLGDIAQERSRSGEEVILAGDLNLTPGHVRPRLEKAGLQDAYQVVHGDDARPPLTSVVGTLDHIAVSENVGVKQIQYAKLERRHPADSLGDKLQDFFLSENVTDHSGVLADVTVS